jgi:hypothetical protein
MSDVLMGQGKRRKDGMGLSQKHKRFIQLLRKIGKRSEWEVQRFAEIRFGKEK